MFTLARTKFYRNLVFEALHRGRRGALRVTTPSGATRLFGGLDKELHAEIRIKNENFYARWVLYGSIGLAESYLHGEWETAHLTQVIAWFFLNHRLLLGHQQRGTERQNVLGMINRVQYLARSWNKKIAKKSLNAVCPSFDFLKHWLDPSMTHSGAYYQYSTETLEEAQHGKWARLCEKLDLSTHDYLLDIGCGYGGFAIYAAQKYRCRVQAITTSEEQLREAAAHVEAAGVTDLVEVLLCDYKNVTGRFDKILSIETLDTVGDHSIEKFFAKIESLLAPQGFLALQLALCPDNQYPFLRDGVDFIQKYIAPTSLTMSLRRITEACSEASDLTLLHYEDMTPSYARTFLAWRQSFMAALPQLRQDQQDPVFLRKWFYYLCYYEAAFGTRSRTAAQLLYTRPNNLGLKSSLYSIAEAL